jgi:hypothetical protein
MALKVPGHALNRIIGGWYVSGIFTTATGVPLLVGESSSSSGAYGGSLAALTATVGAVPSQSMNYSEGLHSGVAGSGGIGVTGNPASGGAGLNLFANPQAVYDNFRPVELSADTINGRDYIRGQKFWNLDMAIGKTFAFTERYRLRFTCEVFNIFNHPDFADPSLSLTSPTSFGVITGQTNSTDGMGVRRLQLGLRFAF